MREVDRRLKKSAKGNEAAKSKTTRNYGKCGESIQSAPVWKRASSIYRSGRCNFNGDHGRACRSELIAQSRRGVQLRDGRAFDESKYDLLWRKEPARRAPARISR